MKKKCILVVEDEIHLRELLRAVFQAAGFDVRTAGDVGEANLHIQKSRVDLVMLDLMLPGMNGLDYLKMLKKEEETENIPVIICTGRMREVDRVIGLESGAEDYIVKPFQNEELVARIKAVLNRCSPKGK